MRLTVNMWTVARCTCNVSFNWLITSSKWTAEALDGTQRLITHRHLSELSQFAIGCSRLRVVIYLCFSFSVVDSDATTISARWIVVHCFHPIADCFAYRPGSQTDRQADCIFWISQMLSCDMWQNCSLHIRETAFARFAIYFQCESIIFYRQYVSVTIYDPPSRVRTLFAFRKSATLECRDCRNCKLTGWLTLCVCVCAQRRCNLDAN